MQQIESNRLRVLSSVHKTAHDLKRRGLFNAAGREANVLFGTCNDNDAETFYNQINEFNQFKLSTSHLMQSQTTIIRNTVNVINETMQRAAKQAEVVDDLITHERITEDAIKPYTHNQPSFDKGRKLGRHF
ncbi:Uncharacterized protein FWK35_00020595 [Aphis craccivora]|uniref:Uncharacterized protein n=1 Tax=Aphis craccivora TaxID=307492 RepID=A0A6G0XTX1_APHCR|nr:Uncharacterized protein FWK35_00020595 [Aphis craccivora]